MWTELHQKTGIQYKKHLGGKRQVELFVKTLDCRSVHYIGIQYSEDNGNPNFRRDGLYFFRGDEPSEYEGMTGIGLLQVPYWPVNRPPMNPKYRSHFDELGKQVPILKQSLDTCVKLLCQSGSKHDQNMKCFDFALEHH